MKGLRTYLRQARKLTAQGKLREADSIFQIIEDGLDIDHLAKEIRKEEQRARNPRPDKKDPGSNDQWAD